MGTTLAAQRVQRHRIRLGMSPEQYGARIKVSGPTVRRVENDYVPFRSTQAKFARDLDVDVDELFPVALPDRKTWA